MRDAYFKPMYFPQLKKMALDGEVHENSDKIDTFSDGISLNQQTEYLTQENAFASILYKVALNQFGEEFLDWEADSININLKKLCAIPDINIDKILSFVSLANSMDGRLNFFNEINCFRHTVNALNNLEPDYEFMGVLVPQHIHWAIYEVGQLYPEYKLDEEPAKLLGLSYNYMGALILPTGIEEYQIFLDEFNKNTELVPHLRNKWQSYIKNPNIDLMDEEDVVDQQMLMLLSDQYYMKYKKDAYLRELEILND